MLLDFIIDQDATYVPRPQSLAMVLGVFTVIIKYQKREKGGNEKRKKNMFCLPITPFSRSLPLFSTEVQDCAMQNLKKACARGSQVTTRRAKLFIFIQCLFSQVIVYDFYTFLPSYNNIKGHNQLQDRADLDTNFASLKSVYLNPNQMTDTFTNPLQSCLVFQSVLDLLLKTSFEQTFTHPLTLFYHIWLKTVSNGT